MRNANLMSKSRSSNGRPFILGLLLALLTTVFPVRQKSGSALNERSSFLLHSKGILLWWRTVQGNEATAGREVLCPEGSPAPNRNQRNISRSAVKEATENRWKNGSVCSACPCPSNCANAGGLTVKLALDKAEKGRPEGPALK